MEAKELRQATSLDKSRRQEDTMIRMKAASVEVIQPAYPTSQWVGETVYGAHSINYSIQNIPLLSLHYGVHVMENFGGSGVGVLRTAIATGTVVRVYTYVDRDPISRKIARHVLI